MDYELYKQLKEAGFPQGKGNYFVGKVLWDETAQSDYETPSTPPRDTWVFAPTLSELIKACSYQFSSLDRRGEGNDLKFIAYSTGMKSIPKEGKTPEEAVARLYLALNN